MDSCDREAVRVCVLAIPMTRSRDDEAGRDNKEDKAENDDAILSSSSRIRILKKSVRIF